MFMTLPRIPYLALILLGAGLVAVPVVAQTANKGSDFSGQTIPGATVVEDIVARVNDQIITQSDYDRAVQQMEAESKQQDLPPQEMQEHMNNLLRDLIDQQLLLSKGKELGISGEAELVRRLDEIRKQNHLASMEDLEKAAAAQGVSYEDFKANIRNSIITQQVVRDEVGQHLDMTESSAMAYYKSHQSEFTQPESVHLSEILVPTAADATSAQIAAAQAKADSISAKLRSGGDFDTLAKTDSSGSTASQGGDLGEFRRGMLAPVLEQKTFDLKTGQYTDPIRTKQGYVILKVDQHTPGGVAPFKDVEQQVEQAVYMQQMEPALRRYLTKLRDEASIDIKPGFVDSGASSNEMHLTYSAYVPPSPKKKKKFARARLRGRAHSSIPKKELAAAGAPTDKQRKAQIARVESQKPGKKEKIRFGQAPRETLGSSQADAAAAAAPDTKSDTAPATQQTATLTNPDVRAVNPDGSTAEEAATSEVRPRKTRYSQRPVVHKAKKSKKKADNSFAEDEPPPPTADETATQKVQDSPLGLADQTKKKKVKVKGGEKTRFSDKTKAPQKPEQQPYRPQSDTGNSQPPAPAQPAPTGNNQQ
jgi:peptidyl-prolyl cis-trans isomerase SurA